MEQDILDKFFKNENAFIEQHGIDFSEYPIDEILGYFKSIINIHHNSGHKIEEEFYGGITGDIPKNLSRHKISNYLACIRVDSAATAARVEQLLHDEFGVYIGEDEFGGKGGNEKSIYVYLAKRNEPGFIDYPNNK